MTDNDINPKGYALTPIQVINSRRLLISMNELEILFGKSFLVTSGIRSVTDQARINPSRPGSYHVQGAAVDVSDPDKTVWGWCIDHLQELVRLGLYLEDKIYTPRWVHFQCLPPKSGHRIFIP